MSGQEATSRVSLISMWIGGMLGCGLYITWLLFPITIITADIGRHIMDGRILLGGLGEYINKTALLHTNYYSLATPDYDIVNHHWAAGIFFYIVHSVAGWKGVHIFSIFCGVFAVLCVSDIARRLTNAKVALLTVAVSLPLIAYRHEVRPEYIGYALLGIIYWLLYRSTREHLSTRYVWLVVPLMILWVNVHASFPIGIALLILFALDSVLRNHPSKKTLMMVLGASAVSLLINPSGIAGALYPLSVLKDPGYAVFENQSIAFLKSIGTTSSVFTLTYIAAALVVAISVLCIAKGKLKHMLPFGGIALLAALMAILAVRHITLFGLVLVPLLAIGIHMVGAAAALPRKYAIGTLIAIFVIACSWQASQLRGRWIVLGLEPGANAAAEFIKEQEIAGPMFNNFDIGGYAIYHFFPDKKPFIYNRPESHPPEFWRDVYIPMMQDSTVWKRELQKYQFNTILFYYGDRTTWAQQFLKARLTDPEWEPIFVDKNILIFIRDVPENWTLIRDFGIPKEKFVVR